MRTLSLLLTGVLAIPCCLATVQGNAPTSTPKRVLILESFGRDFAPWGVLTRTFKTELVQQSRLAIEFGQANVGNSQSTKSPRPALFAAAPVSLAVIGDRPPAPLRQSLAWDRYRWYIVAALVIMIAQAVTILALVVRRARRHAAEASAYELAGRLMASQEDERQRIAGELHDEMGQDLLVIANEAQLSLNQDQNPPGTAARLRNIAETAKHSLQQARKMANKLRPGLLKELGLTKAVRATVEQAGQTSGFSVTLNLANVDHLLPPEFEVNLFRIIQESLNVLKHAEATEVKLMLSRDPGLLRLIVEDNGRGFEVDQPQSAPPEQRGLGLRQIAARAKIMGGHVEIQSRPGRGTRLCMEVPVGKSCP